MDGLKEAKDLWGWGGGVVRYKEIEKEMGRRKKEGGEGWKTK